MEKEERLGIKAFWLFLISNSLPTLAILLIAAVLFVARGYAGDRFLDLLNNLAWGAIVIFVLSFLLAFFISWLIYINYTFSLAEDAFKISHGILNKEETAIPYRQLQSVDLRQDLFGQIIGFGRIVVLTAGHDEHDERGEAEIEFPAIDMELAKRIQSELLKRSETERVIVQR